MLRHVNDKLRQPCNFLSKACPGFPRNVNSGFRVMPKALLVHSGSVAVHRYGRWSFQRPDWWSLVRALMLRYVQSSVDESSPSIVCGRFCHFKATNFKSTWLLWAIVYFSDVVATPFQPRRAVPFHFHQLWKQYVGMHLCTSPRQWCLAVLSLSFGSYP